MGKKKVWLIPVVLVCCIAVACITVIVMKLLSGSGKTEETRIVLQSSSDTSGKSRIRSKTKQESMQSEEPAENEENDSEIFTEFSGTTDAAVTAAPDPVQNLQPPQETPEPVTENAKTPFYGVWIASSKSKEEMEEWAREARSLNFDASVVYTSEWSNLNDGWYSVTCGRFASKAEAQTCLESARSAGYQDAYIKYSGQ